MALLSDHDGALEHEHLSLTRDAGRPLVLESVLRAARRAKATFRRRRKASVVTLLAPDVLIICFEKLSFNDRLLASHVCRYWRRVAISTPLLWSTFDIAEEQEGKLDEMLHRSQSAPLSVKLLLSPDEEKALRPHFAHVRVLQCHNPPRKLHAPQLETVEISLTQTDTVVLSKYYVGSSAQSLQTLQLCAFSIAPTCPVLGNLREFRGVFSPETSLGALLALCPSLESLTVWCNVYLGVDPQPLFISLPPTLTEVTVSGLLMWSEPTIHSLDPWLSHRFRRLEFSRLYDIASVLHLFGQSINQPDATWSMDILVEDNAIFTLRTPTDRMRIVAPASPRSNAIVSIEGLQQFQPHINQLTELSLSLLYFDVCIEMGVELPRLTALSLISNPDRDEDDPFCAQPGSAGMRVPLLRLFAFTCRPGHAFRRVAVKWFFTALPSQLRQWLRYDAEKLDMVALRGLVSRRALRRAKYLNWGIYSLAREVRIEAT
ncbi:hypothetical protein AURDEDRAFT_184955 [Auricularia subglabra TFB-10046 SS5]|nr:hypothetical protein AURDEDRAFT_184955 [Auricularia subglabra TFB-10046 SS5]